MLAPIRWQQVRRPCAILRTVINHPGIPLGLAVLVGALLIRALMGRSIGWALDTFGILLCLRCILQFLQLNILLLVPLKAGALLLTQLVLFLQVLIVAFAWLYWRLDGRAIGHHQKHLIFSEGFGDDGFIDYLYISSMALLQFEPSGAIPTTAVMKGLFVLQGIMMMDLVGLNLSRAIGLAGAGG